MKLNKIEITPTETDLPNIVQLRFFKDSGENHRGTIAASEIENLETYIQQCANSIGEEADLSKCDEIRVMAGVEFPEDSILSRIDFPCGPVSVSESGEYTYPENSFVLQAKTKDKRVKGDGQAMAAAFCYQNPDTGDWIDTDIDSCDQLPEEFKACFKALRDIERNGVKRNPRLFQIHAEKRLLNEQ